MTDKQLALLLRRYRVELEMAVAQVEKQLPLEMAEKHTVENIDNQCRTMVYIFPGLEPLNDLLDWLDYDIDTLEDRQPSDD